MFLGSRSKMRGGDELVEERGACAEGDWVSCGII